MHLRQWHAHKPDNSWLFLNLDFDQFSRLDDLCLHSLLDEVGRSGQEVVVEIVESKISDEVLFEQLIMRLRALGCLIALDDFGAGHSNIDRIWKIQPDIVKLDRQVLLQATKSARGVTLLRNLTRLIKQAGCLCLLEGIETHQQALMAMEAGVDWVQGFYFARPLREQAFAQDLQRGQWRLAKVMQTYPQYVAQSKNRQDRARRPYERLYATLEGCDTLTRLEGRMQQLAAKSGIKRFFILDARGYQLSDEGPGQAAFQPKAFHDLAVRPCALKSGKGLCWKNRRYFLKAWQYPGQLYVSEPYRSMIDMQLCTTLAQVVEMGTGEQVVACFDLFYQESLA
jgi:hypothetical protein